MAARTGRRASGMSRQETRWAWLFLTPWVIGFLVFTGGPMIASLVLSFTEYDVISAPQFVGLDNYRQLMSDPAVAKSLGNTVFYTALHVPLAMAVSLALALLLQRVGPRRPRTRPLPAARRHPAQVRQRPARRRRPGRRPDPLAAADRGGVRPARPRRAAGALQRSAVSERDGLCWCSPATAACTWSTASGAPPGAGTAGSTNRGPRPRWSPPPR